MSQHDEPRQAAKKAQEKAHITRDELLQAENTGLGILGALGMAAVGIIGAVIAGANKRK